MDSKCAEFNTGRERGARGIEDGSPLRGRVDQDVGRVGGKAQGRQAEGAADDPGSGVARRGHVHFAVADEDRLFGEGAGLFHQGSQAHRVRLLEGKAIAAVDVEKEGRQVERLADGLRGANGLVGQHGHAARGPFRQCAHGGKGLMDALVSVGKVQFVFTIVVEKPGVCAGQEILVDFGCMDAEEARRTSMTAPSPM